MTRSKTHSFPLAGLLWLVCLDGSAQPSSESPPAPASYERLIAELETRQHVSETDVQLSEAYAGLGNSLQTLERHDDAVRAYEQALLLLRQSKGLATLDQLPVLQARLVSNQALESWQDVDADRHLAYLIAMKNPAADAVYRYQTLRELGLWRLQAADEDLLPNSLDAAREAADLYRQELEHPETRAAYQGSPLSLANLYLDLAALEFLQARKKLALPLSAYVVGGQRTVTEMYCETIPTPDGRGRQVCRNVQVPNLDYFMSLSDRKYRSAWDHLEAMQDAVLDAWAVLLPAVETPNRDKALTLLAEVHRMTDAFNDFVAQNGRRGTGSRIAAPTGSRISR